MGKIALFIKTMAVIALIAVATWLINNHNKSEQAEKEKRTIQVEKELNQALLKEIENRVEIVILKNEIKSDGLENDLVEEIKKITPAFYYQDLIQTKITIEDLFIKRHISKNRIIELSEQYNVSENKLATAIYDYYVLESLGKIE